MTVPWAGKRDYGLRVVVRALFRAEHGGLTVAKHTKPFTATFS